MDRIKDKCDQDLECLSSEFASALSRYEGKNALPAATVNKAFKSVVGTSLVKALYSNDETALNGSITAIQNLLQELPSEYKNLKQGVMELVKLQTTTAAQKVTASYSQLSELAKQNNPQAYLEAVQSTKQEHNALIYLANSYSSAIQESVSLSEDLSAISYYQKSYLPNMQKIMSGVMVTTTTNQTNTNQPSVIDRTGRDGNTNVPQNTTTVPTVNGNGTINSKAQWTFPTAEQTNGLSTGSFSNQPTVNGRGGRQ
jgi:hypothetical protein